MPSQEAFNDLNRLRTRAFVTEQGSATIVCPNCEITKNITVADYRGNKHSLKIRCRCQQTFTIDLEFRQFHRKPTDLVGFYEISSGDGGRAVIKDLSKNGLGFMVSGVHNVRVGQKILLNFALDDQKGTTLKKMTVVRSVDDKRIGCEFRKDQAFEKDLGFYLRT